MMFAGMEVRLLTILYKKHSLAFLCSALRVVRLVESVTITDDLSWSKQVSSVVSKARRILGMIYCKFYRFYGTSTILRLYKAYVKPHLNYCSSVWDPPLVKDQEALESVQRFALRLCCKNWSAAYLQLLTWSRGCHCISVQGLSSDCAK